MLEESRLITQEEYDEYMTLKMQVKEANEVIKLYDDKYGQHYTTADGTIMGNSPAWKYMLRWGVK